MKYDSLVRQGHSKDRVVHSRFQDLVPAQVSKEDDPELQRPDDEAIAEVSDALYIVDYFDF